MNQYPLLLLLAQNGHLLGQGGSSLLNMVSSPLSLLVVAAAVGYVIYRQMRPRPLSTREVVVLPLVLAFYAWRTLSGEPLGSLDIIITVLVLFGLLGLAFGLVSSTAIRVYPDPNTGEATVSGSWKYLGWILLYLVARVGVIVALRGDPAWEEAARASSTTLVSASCVLGMRSVYLFVRASALGLPLVSKDKTAKRAARHYR